MGSNKIVVQEVVSPGSVRGADGKTYVLRGVPDVQEEFVRFSEARELAEKALLGAELTYNEETAHELPDLPGVEIEAFDDDGRAVMPALAARVAGVLVGHPMGGTRDRR